MHIYNKKDKWKEEERMEEEEDDNLALEWKQTMQTTTKGSYLRAKTSSNFNTHTNVAQVCEEFKSSRAGRLIFSLLSSFFQHYEETFDWWKSACLQCEY